MKFDTNKEKGNTGLGMAIAYYSSNGYTVSLPLNDTQDYDLIVDKDNKLKRVQVKATSCKTKYGEYKLFLILFILLLEFFENPVCPATG